MAPWALLPLLSEADWQHCPTIKLTYKLRPLPSICARYQGTVSCHAPQCLSHLCVSLDHPMQPEAMLNVYLRSNLEMRKLDKILCLHLNQSGYVVYSGPKLMILMLWLSACLGCRCASSHRHFLDTLCVYCVFPWGPQKSERGIESPRAGAMDGCRPTCKCWGLNPGPLQEQVLCRGHPQPTFVPLESVLGSGSPHRAVLYGGESCKHSRVAACVET